MLYQKKCQRCKVRESRLVRRQQHQRHQLQQWLLLTWITEREHEDIGWDCPSARRETGFEQTIEEHCLDTSSPLSASGTCLDSYGAQYVAYYTDCHLSADRSMEHRNGKWSRTGDCSSGPFHWSHLFTAFFTLDWLELLKDGPLSFRHQWAQTSQLELYRFPKIAQLGNKR